MKSQLKKHPYEKFGLLVICALVFSIGSIVSVTSNEPQQAAAKSPSMKSLIGNNTLKLGVISMPIVCTTLNDVLNSTLSGVLGGGMTTDTGNNDTNSTQGMMMDMMKQGMENLTQGKLQQLKDFVFCSPASEKMVRSMMK